MQYGAVTSEVIGYIKSKYDSEPEFLWKRTPNNAVFRHQGNRKWFAALLLDMPREKLGLVESGKVDVLNLKCDPLLLGSLLDGKRYLPGYHMNKEHWITLLLDGSIPLHEIFELIDMSRRLTCKKEEDC